MARRLGREVSAVDEVIAAASAAVREAERRARGESPDRRFDIPITILRDLADMLAAPAADEEEPPKPKPPVGATWCFTHGVYDLCETGL